jgi:hypothetical protein
VASAYLAAAAVALGHAIQIANGFYAPAALPWLTLAFVCSAMGVARPGSRLDRRALAVPVVLAGLVWQFADLLRTDPGQYLETTLLGPFRAGIAVEATIVAAGRARPDRRLAAGVPGRTGLRHVRGLRVRPQGVLQLLLLRDRRALRLARDNGHSARP